MAKLLAYFFKRDRVALLLGFGIPLLGSLLSTLSDAAETTLILTMVVYLASVAVAVVVLIRDYRAFYGDRSPLFSALPLTGGQVVGARFVYFTILTLLMALLSVYLSYRIFGLLSVLTGGGLDPALNMFFQALSRPLTIPLLVSLGIVNLLMEVVLWLFAVSVGSERPFRRFSFGGPILVYFLTSVVVLLAIPALVRLFPFGFVYEWGAGFHLSVVPLMADAGGLPLVMWIVPVLCIAGGLARAIYSHNRKLSAY